jgi:diphthamide synthase (EF-2-diphthine--ammonia ligase)
MLLCHLAGVPDAQVAALGLPPYKHLGRSIADLQPHLLRLADTYGCNPCGEGGEYETLTLDCPLFTAGRLELTEWQVRQRRACMRGSVQHNHVQPVAPVSGIAYP